MLLFALPVFCVVFLSGCWNYRELNTMTIVAGIAIDRSADNNGYHLTFEVLDIAEASGEKSTSVSPLLIETDGLTIFDACRNALERSDKKLYFGACKTIIISEELAREGITPVLDLFRRDAEARSTMDVYISGEETAAAILKHKSVTNTIVSYSVGMMNSANLKALSKSIYIQLYEVNDILNGEGVSLALPVLKIGLNNGEKVPVSEGTAVFKADKLVGYLDSLETKYFSFIKEEIEGGLILISVDSDVENTSLEILSGKTAIETKITDGRPEITVNVSINVALAEFSSQEDCDTEEKLREIEDIASETVSLRLCQLIERVQRDYASDIFGFGNMIYKHHKKYWDEVGERWDDIFASLDVKVETKVKIVNTAGLFKKNTGE